jgi:hypothetical protein
MKNSMNPKKPAAWLRLAAATILSLGALCPPQASAQVPARFYWKSLTGANAVPLVFNSISGNSNPFDPAHTVLPGSSIDASMAIAGYAHTFELGDRAASAAILVPMGRLSGQVTAAGRTFNESASGFGDPMLELNVNLIGPKAQKNIPDNQRYEPGFSMDLIADLAFPIGTYDSSKPLNIGLNRWYGRVGAPIVWQLGDWVPGRRTTLEFLPAVWLFGANNDFVGQTLKTDPMFQLDAHLTRDFTQNLWGSLDAVYYAHGASSINGVPGNQLNVGGVGFTLGYQVNDNLAFTFGYKSTLNNGSDPTALRMDSFMMSLVFGWHPLVEGMKRLKSE